MNKYDEHFKGIMNTTTLLNKMWYLLDKHPEDKEIIIKAFSKQDSKIIRYESSNLKNLLTEH